MTYEITFISIKLLKTRIPRTKTQNITDLTSGGQRKMTEEMAPRLRAHTALTEHPMAHPNPLYFSSRVSDALPLLTFADTRNTYTQATHTHI